MNYQQPYQPPSILVVAFGGHVFGIAPGTGVHIWEREIQGQTPRIHALYDRVLVHSAQVLHCLALGNGATMWEVPVKDLFDTTTFLCDGTFAYLGSSGSVTTILVADGRVLWTDGFKGKGTFPVALAVPGLAEQIDLRK
jgi:hypothetical protein